MNPLWDYFWPIFAAGLIIGAVSGHLAYRQLRIGRSKRLASESLLIGEWRRMRKLAYGGGAAAALVAAALWHGPLGAGARLTDTIERATRSELQRQEMTGISARLEREPLLRRQLVLSGPADDFQESQLVRILDAKPGVAGVRWAPPPQPSDGVK